MNIIGVVFLNLLILALLPTVLIHSSDNIGEYGLKIVEEYPVKVNNLSLGSLVIKTKLGWKTVRKYQLYIGCTTADQKLLKIKEYRKITGILYRLTGIRERTVRYHEKLLIHVDNQEKFNVDC